MLAKLFFLFHIMNVGCHTGLQHSMMEQHVAQNESSCRGMQNISLDRHCLSSVNENNCREMEGELMEAKDFQLLASDLNVLAGIPRINLRSEFEPLRFAPRIHLLLVIMY
jgi:hypothetical protein